MCNIQLKGVLKGEYLLKLLFTKGIWLIWVWETGTKWPILTIDLQHKCGWDSFESRLDYLHSVGVTVDIWHISEGEGPIGLNLQHITVNDGYVWCNTGAKGPGNHR